MTIRTPLWKPAQPGLMPSEKIGEARMDFDAWDRIRAVARYANHPIMDLVSLFWRERLEASSNPPIEASVTAPFHKVVAENVRWYSQIDGRGPSVLSHTFLVVQSPEHQATIASLAGRGEWWTHL